MRLAIIHDSCLHLGGAERILLKLIDLYPQADIFTSLLSPDLLHQIQVVSKGKITYSRLSKFRVIRKYSSLVKPYFYQYYWESLPLNDYDLVISITHSFCAHWIKTTAKHLSYFQTPPRFLYGYFNEMRLTQTFPFNLLLMPYLHWLRLKDVKKVNKIDLLIANSKNIQHRILKHYKTSSSVIYPPVSLQTNISLPREAQSKPYLFFSRLVKQKGAMLAIQAFNKLTSQLIIVGTGPLASELKKIAGKNIQFMGFVPDTQMGDVFKKCQALIFTARQEDFGMIPVEAMSAGLPVIAYGSGGILETVIHKKTGWIFKEYSLKSLIHAIHQYEMFHINPEDCIQQSQKFSAELFEREFTKAVRELLS